MTRASPPLYRYSALSLSLFYNGSLQDAIKLHYTAGNHLQKVCLSHHRDTKKHTENKFTRNIGARAPAPFGISERQTAAREEC